MSTPVDRWVEEQLKGLPPLTDEQAHRVATILTHGQQELNMPTCDAYSTARKGICGRPLDEHGQCDRAGDHGDHLADR